MGWQIVLILLVIYLLRKTYLAVKRYQRNAYRRDALTWLDKLPEYNPDHPAEVFRQLPTLLRKTALCAYSRKAVILPLRKTMG